MTTSLQSVSNPNNQIIPLEISYLQYGDLSSNQIRERIQSNVSHIASLKGNISANIRRSALFELGVQEINEALQRLCAMFMEQLQEETPIVHLASTKLVKQFGIWNPRSPYNANNISLYEDIYETDFKKARADFAPSKQLIDQLQMLMTDNLQLIQKQFARMLQIEGQRIVQYPNSEVRDGACLKCRLLKPLSIFFPKRSDTLKKIYASFLEIEWLKYDRYQLNGYLEMTRPLLTTSLNPNPLVKDDDFLHEQLKRNLRYRLRLQDQLSDSFHDTSLFQVGEQEDDFHLQELFKVFFTQDQEAESLINKAAKMLMNHFGGYHNVCEEYQVELSELTYLNGNENNENENEKDRHATIRATDKKSGIGIFEELHRLVEKSDDFKYRFLESLKKQEKMLTEGLKISDHDYCSYLPTSNDSVRRDQVKLQDIFTKLLVIAWLEEDSKELSIELGFTKPIFDILSDVPPAFILREKIYGLRPTQPDGACGLHALLGELHEGKYVCLENPRPIFIRKIRENFQDSKIRDSILEVLLGHLNAQEDRSSQMLFATPAGQNLKQHFLKIRNRFQTELGLLKKEEADLWVQEMPSIREKVLEGAKQLAYYTGMKDDAILNVLQTDTLKLLNLISSEKQIFLKLLELHRTERILIQQTRQYEILTRWSNAESDCLIHQIYPHYLTVLSHSKFFLNTQEVILAALLFHKKAQVIHAQGEAATDTTLPDIEGQPVIIYHKDCHFFRCTSCTQEEFRILTNSEKFKQINKIYMPSQLRQDAFDYL